MRASNVFFYKRHLCLFTVEFIRFCMQKSSYALLEHGPDRRELLLAGIGALILSDVSLDPAFAATFNLVCKTN
jgi:uncharacterized membrane protein